MNDDRGTFIKYVDIKFGEERLAFIMLANSIIEEYAAQGLDMTLRQVHYQMVSRHPDIYPNDSDGKSYDKLQSAVNDGRLAGIISWTSIIDRDRNLMGFNTQISVESAVDGLIGGYKRDLWVGQRWRPEVWVEKVAQIGNISSVCNELRVDYFACKGYNSQSEAWRAGRRFAGYIQRGQTPIVFHLGDHDPSGVNMTDDIRTRLEMFAGVPINVQRLALNMNQIITLNPPENPAKLKTDSRGKAYVRYMQDLGYGYMSHLSWEQDALTPTFIRDLIRDAVLRVRDEKEWEVQVEQENEDIRRLQDFKDGMD